MIRKFQIKFCTMAMLTTFLLLTVILVSVNLLNYRSLVIETDETLNLISRNHGIFPDTIEFDQKQFHVTLETPYELRYFSIVLNFENDVIYADLDKIKAIDRQQAIDYAIEIKERHESSGFIEQYRYLIYPEDNGIRISFLDCGRKLMFHKNFVYTSIQIGLVGYILFCAIIIIFSHIIIQPVIISQNKQKQFITNAGHEIKTPLTIIKTDAEILEMDYPEQNEWISDIKKQTSRLTKLTNDLIYLSKTEENNTQQPFIDFPISDIVTETIQSFSTLAQSQNKKLVTEIQPVLTLHGNDQAITQLTTILIDNALKYSPENTDINIKLQKQNKNIVFSVTNTTLEPISKQDLSKLFERFYRTDPSRNSQTGGHGIGLSIAQAIVSKHKGKIQATTPNENTLCIKCIFTTPKGIKT